MYLAKDSVGAAKLIVATQPKGPSPIQHVFRLDNLAMMRKFLPLISQISYLLRPKPNNINRSSDSHSNPSLKKTNHGIIDYDHLNA